LLGGWAVYLTVNKNYQNDKGRDYHGSKEIDLGFHFSSNETKESIERSAFNQSIKALEDNQSAEMCSGRIGPGHGAHSCCTTLAFCENVQHFAAADQNLTPRNPNLAF